MHLVPGHAHGELVTGLPEGACLVRVLAKAAGGTGELARIRCGDETRATVGDDLERPAGVRRRQNGLLGEERLVRHHPEVLVDGCVVDGEAASVERRELGLADPAGELRATVQPVLVGDRLEAIPVRVRRP